MEGEKKKIIVNTNIVTWYESYTKLTWMRCSLEQTWSSRGCISTAKKIHLGRDASGH